MSVFTRGRTSLLLLLTLFSLAFFSARPAQAAPKNVLISGVEMNSTIQGYLSTLGYTSTIVDPASFGTVSFSGYSAIWLGWQTTFTGLASRRADLIAFANAGGNVLAEYADSGNSLSDYPYGADLTAGGSYGDSVFTTDTSSPINAGLTDAGLSSWGSSYHDYFTGISDFSGLTDNGTSGQWVTITKAVGAGNLIYTGQDISYHIKNGSNGSGASSPKGVFLNNALGLVRANPVPGITNINPTSTFAGSGGFTLTVDGTNFVGGGASVVYWNSTALTTTFVGPNELLASVPPSLVASTGTVSINVVTSGPGGGTSGSLPFTIYGSAGVDVSPTIVYQGAPSFGKVSLSAPAPSGGLSLSLTSSDPSVASVPSTVTVLAGHTSATFPIATYKLTADTTVTIAASVGGTSSSTLFTVKTKYSVSGTITIGGSPLKGVNVRGQANGTFTVTSYTQPTTNTIPANGTLVVPVTVRDPGTLADVRVGVSLTHPSVGNLRLTLISPAGTEVLLQNYSGNTDANLLTDYPVLSAPAASLAVLGGEEISGTWYLKIENNGGFSGTLNLFHLNFTYSGTLTSNYGSLSNGNYAVGGLKAETYKIVPIKAGYVFSPSSVTVTVGPSASGYNFTAYALPTLASLSPSTAYAGTGAFTLSLTGTGFVNGSVVTWNNAALTTTYVSSTQLTASVPASLLASAGTAEVIVVNPSPGGSSNLLLFTVNAGLKSLSLSKTSVAGGTGVTGTVTLTDPAPAGGKAITLASSDTGAVTVPASVTVAAGSTSATFSVTTKASTSDRTVTITASGAGAAKTATLTLTATKLSALDLASAVTVGGTGVTATVTLTGPAPAGGFTVTPSSSNTAVATVPASVTVAAGSTTATFTVTSKAVTANTNVVIGVASGTVTKSKTLTVTPPAAHTSALAPTADAYVRDGTYAASNFGTATTEYAQKGTSNGAGNNRDTYIKFSIKGFTHVTSAKLRIYAAVSASGSASAAVNSVTATSWGETTITYNNRPAEGGSQGAVTVSSTKYAFYEIDVTSYVANFVASGKTTLALALHGTTASATYIKFNSRENAGNQPQLIVTGN